MKTIFLFCGLLTSSVVFGQSTDASSAWSLPLDTNMILLLFALFLLIPLWAVSKTFTIVMRHYLKEKAGKNLKVLLPFCLLLSTQLVWGQASEEPARMEWWTEVLTTGALLFVIALEFWLIVFFTTKMNHVLKHESGEGTETVSSSIWSRIAARWSKMNFKPIEEEAALDTGHSYDGIRELNNITPPWFTTAFALSIVFAFVYMYRYHVAKSAPLMIEEYEISVKKAEIQHEEYLRQQANNIDENNIAVMTGTDLEAGKNTFLTLCAVCHRADGGGQVGPNLTDDYWIHGGSLKQIFSTIKYGVPDKGMISWKSQLSPQQIAQVSNYIMQLHGTQPADPKEKQGELYVPEANVQQDTTHSDTTGQLPGGSIGQVR